MPASGGAAAKVERQLTPGQVVDGKYVVRRRLGSGGMGVVYLADQRTLARQVAIKILRRDDVADGKVIERFHLEARAAAAVGHPGIVDVIDVGWADGSPYLVMEYLEGESLADLLGRATCIDPSAVATIGVETLSALAAAHGKGIVHRDLKPENIFITRFNDGSEHIKLLDFGLSKIVGPEGSLRLTHTGVVLGTPYYMAPEQARGAKDLDHRIDIWALGVVLYEAATGQVPYDGENYNELMAKIIGEPFPLPSEVNETVPPELEATILRAMEKDRDARYRTAAEFLEELQRVRERLPRAARLSTPGRGASLSASRFADPRISGTTGPLPALYDSHVSATPSGRDGARSPGASLRPLSGEVPAFVEPVEAAPVAAPRRRTARYLWIALGVTLLGFAAGLVGVVLMSGRAEPAAGPAAGGAAAAPGPDPVPPTDPSVETTPVPPDVERVSVRLEGVPEGARVLVDGEPAPGTSFEVDRGDRELDVAVEVAGRVVVRRMLRPTGNIIVDLAGARWPTAGPDAGAAAAEAAAKALAPRPGRRPPRGVARRDDAAPAETPAEAPVAVEAPTKAPPPEPPPPRPEGPVFRGSDLPIVTEFPGSGARSRK